MAAIRGKDRLFDLLDVVFFLLDITFCLFCLIFQGIRFFFQMRDLPVDTSGIFQDKFLLL